MLLAYYSRLLESMPGKGAESNLLINLVLSLVILFKSNKTHDSLFVPPVVSSLVLANRYYVKWFGRITS
jgi:hypothetical protein